MKDSAAVEVEGREAEPEASHHEDVALPPDQALELSALVWFGKRVNLAADMSPEASRAMQLSLGANILRALGEEVGGPVELHWPVFSNPHVPGNDEAGLRVVCERLLGNAGTSRWLLLGPGVTQGLAGKLTDQEHSIWLAEALSLTALSSDAALKRRLWDACRQKLADEPLDE